MFFLIVSILFAVAVALARPRRPRSVAWIRMAALPLKNFFDLFAVAAASVRPNGHGS